MRQLAARTTLGVCFLAVSLLIPIVGASAATPADLALTATGSTAVASGTNAVYALTVKNVGGEAASGEVRLSISFTAPQVDLAFGTGWQCTIAGRDVVCTRPGPVAAGVQLPPVLMSVPVHAADVLGWAFISPPRDTNFANDMAEMRTTALVPDLTVSATPPFAKVPVGGTSAASITVTNAGAGTAVGTTTVQLTGQATAAVQASGTGWVCVGAAPVSCTSTQYVNANASLPPLSATFRAAAGTKTMALGIHVSHPNDPNPNNNNSQSVVQVGPAPDLEITMAPVTDYFVANRVARHTVVVRNVGELTAFGPITVTARTSDLFDLRATGNGWDCKRPDLETLICTNALSLAPGASLIPMSVNGDALGEWGTDVSVLVDVAVASDLNPTNDSADAQTPIAPLIGLVPDIDDGGATTTPGGSVSYAVHVRNVGTLPSVGPITFEYEATGATLTGVGSDWLCIPGLCTAQRNAPSLGALPLLTLSGRVTGPGGSDVIVSGTLFNDSDETDQDDIVFDDTPIVGPPPPSTTTTTTTVAPTVPPSSATSTTSTTATPPTTAPSSTTSAPTTTTTTTTPTTTTPTTTAAPSAPGIRIADVTVVEPNADTVAATFVFTLSQPSPVKVTAKYATVDGTAIAGSDYSGRSDTVAFNPGETVKTATVPIRGDTTGEPLETFSVVLSSPVGAPIADGTAVGTIVDNDPPGLRVSDASITESDAAQTMSFVVSLSKPSTTSVSVHYATEDRDARAPSDYFAVGGTLTFAPGEVFKIVNVTIVGDTLDERSEDLHLVLTQPVGAVLLDDVGIGKIFDDE